MTRCLDCGADRTADQCSACGLTSAAGRVGRSAAAGAAHGFFLVGIIVFIAASRVFPSEIDAILIFAGLVFFLSLAWVTGSISCPETAGSGSPQAHLLGMIPVAMDFAGRTLSDGKLDNSRPFVFPLPVVGKFPRMVCRAAAAWWLRPGAALGGSNASRWIKYDYDRFQRGDDIVVQGAEGPFGLRGSAVYTAVNHCAHAMRFRRDFVAPASRRPVFACAAWMKPAGETPAPRRPCALRQDSQFPFCEALLVRNALYLRPSRLPTKEFTGARRPVIFAIDDYAGRAKERFWSRPSPRIPSNME